MEAFYLESGRTGKVKTAGDSIVTYQRWRSLGDQSLLDDIERYNEIDCRSTLLCRDWLLTLRPAATQWFTGRRLAADHSAKIQAREDAETRSVELASRLLDNASPDDLAWRRLLVDLLKFSMREAKPTLWAMFARQEMDGDQPLSDAECIAGPRADPGHPPRPNKRSTVHRFTFPTQDFKVKVGDLPLPSGTLEPAGETVLLDENSRSIELKLGLTRSPLDEGSSLIPQGPMGDKQLREAVYRYADAVAEGHNDRYRAITDILRAHPPRLFKRDQGSPALEGDADAMRGAVEALRLLHDSYLLIQGPPGAANGGRSRQFHRRLQTDSRSRFMFGLISGLADERLRDTRSQT